MLFTDMSSVRVPCNAFLGSVGNPRASTVLELEQVAERHDRFRPDWERARLCQPGVHTCSAVSHGVHGDNIVVKRYSSLATINSGFVLLEKVHS